MLFFHSENRTFHNIAITVGDFPQNIWWYQIHIVNEKPTFAISGKKRKRDSDAPQISSSTTPRVIICGWTPYPNTDDLIPEFWEYLPLPEDKITCQSDNLGHGPRPPRNSLDERMLISSRPRQARSQSLGHICQGY